MYIKSLELSNFRNYDTLTLSFDEGTNILYGDNAQGKTNILEALYMAATTKSHRSSKDRELIRFESDEAHIKVFVIKEDVPLRIDIHLKKNKTKGIAINGLPIRKASELFGVLNVVFFSPEDLNLIKSGPSERRKFMDMELCQLDKLYVYNLIHYNKILNQRNKLLKDISFSERKELFDTLDIWDLQLAEYGTKVIERRIRFIEELNELIVPIHARMTNQKEQLTLCYEPNCSSIDFYEHLQKNRDRDVKYHTTTIGPHRDDFGFFLVDRDMRKYGSQGQQRTVALSLKLAEIELVKRRISDIPILLLDDVLSELDSSRQRQLLESIKGIQTMITCTGLDEFVENQFCASNVYKVFDGTVERSSNE